LVSINKMNLSILDDKLTECRFKDCGRILYQDAFALQMKYVDEVINGHLPIILICEHKSVLTLGRMTKDDSLLLTKDVIQKNGVEICSVNRGGDVTLHCPGQWVIYPIFNLAKMEKNLHAYLSKLEQVGIDLCNDFDVLANRVSDRTGVWIKSQKIGSIGIGVRKWVSFHGLSINVNPDLRLYQMIRPCGLDIQMTSIAAQINQKITMDDVKLSIRKWLSYHFHLTFTT